MDEKFNFLKSLREKHIDPVSPSAFYRGFINYFEELVAEEHASSYMRDHYLRYCCTVRDLDGIGIDFANALICESGHPSTVTLYLETLGATIECALDDLRYPLSMPSDRFDLVFSLEVIEHIKDHDSDELADISIFNRSGVKTYSSEMARLVKPGGHVLITTPNPNSLMSLDRLLRFDPPSVFRPHVREYTKTELIEFFPDFKVVKYQANYCFGYFEYNRVAKVPDTLAKLGIPIDDRGDDHFLLLRKPDQ